MTFKEFSQKIFSRYLWGNLIGMLLLVVALGAGLFFFLDYYTYHGETLPVPNVCGERSEVGIRKLEALGFRAEVSDTGYNANLAADVILDQNISPGTEVKPHRLILLTVNAAAPRPVALPDLADNSSLREAKMKLEAMGFKLTPAKRIRGEKDWVYRIELRGRELRAGERVPVGLPLTLVVGDGTEEDAFNGNDSLDRIYFGTDSLPTVSLEE